MPLNSLQGQSRFEYYLNIQMLAFDARIGFHINNNMDEVTEGTAFACCYFCKDFLPKDLIVEKLVKFNRPLMDYITWDVNKEIIKNEEKK